MSLSVTNSITDVKIRLEAEYDDYGFASERVFTAAITIALENARLLKMTPVIGSSSYTTIKAKDKVSLTEKEELYYWAEVYFACSEVVSQTEVTMSIPSSDMDYSSQKLDVEGYSYENRFNINAKKAKSAALSTIRKFFYEKALEYMTLTGWNPNQLQRGGGAFGSPVFPAACPDTVGKVIKTGFE